ncbi:MAG: PDZ domain-containing protein [Acidobacteriia bacterium]|nr:PDZ domain-containing protein [Terriglobia bacterium]
MKARSAALIIVVLAVAAMIVVSTRAQDTDKEKPQEGARTVGPVVPHPAMGRRFRIGIDGGGTWLGVALKDLTVEEVKELKLPGEYGVEVKEVVDDSPAAKAGLVKGDIILEFAGEKVRSGEQLRRLVRETPPDHDVTIVVRRGSETKTLTAKVGKPKVRTYEYFESPEYPQTFNVPMPHPMPEVHVPDFNLFWMQRGARLGISADELTSQLAQYFGVKQGKGVLVREVVVGSAAEKAGLKAGDIIVAVDGKEVATVSALRRALAGNADQKEKRTVALTIVRDKHEQTVNVELEPPQQFGRRQMTFAEPLIDSEDAEEWAAEAKDLAREYAEQAKEWEKEQRGLQKEQEELQQEMQRLHEELPQELGKEIKL